MVCPNYSSNESEKIDGAELKRLAREQIKGNISKFFVILLLAFLILGVSCITGVGLYILIGPMMLGIHISALELVRFRRIEIGSLFKGFKAFGASFTAGLLTGLFILLWSAVIFVLGIIASIRYSQTFFILADSDGLSGLDAMDYSKDIMKGHKMEFFLLNMSFFGWFLLGIITGGIAFIYVAPYIMITQANFYEKLKSIYLAKNQGTGDYKRPPQIELQNQEINQFQNMNSPHEEERTQRIKRTHNICPHCKTPAAEADLFCQKCGIRL